MRDREHEEPRRRWNPEEERERSRTAGTERGSRSEEEERGSSFEDSVSNINTDPDAGFDFGGNPTDASEPRRSER